jgi:ribosomal protein S18 acetylase RimI-like enzyme
MRVEPAAPDDLAAVREAYAGARAIQQGRGATLWPEFADGSILSELEAGRLFRVMDGEALVGVFSVAYEDQAIWGEHERGAHIYLHRIARAATYPGRGLLGAVLAWARARCRALGRAGLRMDTWASNEALVAFYVRQGFRVVGRRRIGKEPRLPPHYHGIEVTLLEEAIGTGVAADVAERADAAFVTHVGWALARTPGMLSRVTPELVLADSGLPCDSFNFVCRSRLTSAAVRAVAGEAVSHFRRPRRPFSWWVGPADRPAELGAVLEELGLERAESELAMAVPLDGVPGPGPEAPGLEVRRVRTRDELAALAQLSAANWEPPDPDVLEFYRRTADALLAPDAPQWFYLGYVDGEPVATAEAAVSDGTVALFNISTRESFRGRRIGSRMTWQALRDARASGCDLAVLQAAPAGVGVYRRLGFEPFGEITEYKPSP